MVRLVSFSTRIERTKVLLQSDRYDIGGISPSEPSSCDERKKNAKMADLAAG